MSLMLDFKVDPRRSRVARQARPDGLVRRPEQAEDPLDLIHLILTWHERLAPEQLADDAARRPKVHALVIPAAAKEQLGRAVPQRHHLPHKSKTRTKATLLTKAKACKTKEKCANPIQKNHDRTEPNTRRASFAFTFDVMSLVGTQNSLARPKSASFSVPLELYSRLLILRSRCTIQFK
eukprot:scaffold1428_cov259-Pinguiococcus_pyrenoidosus.AAC.6